MPFTYSPQERERCLDPLTSAIRGLQRSGETVIVAIQGGQGTGKTTLSGYLASALSGETTRVAAFSIDDFYKSHEARRLIAAQHPGNPYYQLPRGMPGTHRTALLHDVLSRLRCGVDVDLPVFDKSAHRGAGDVAESAVPVRGRQDVVLFEGWCVGMPAASPAEVIDICRRHQLLSPAPEHLAPVLVQLEAYQPLWAFIDFFVMLRPDSPLCHEDWRLQQERDLIARTGVGLRDDQVRDLVRHFLPFTYLCYERVEPDALIRIDGGHRYYAMSGPA